MDTRQDFHNLIDQIQDEEVLRSYFKLIQKLNNTQTGELWETLSPQEKNELLLSYDESLNADQLVPHEQIKKQHQRWLEK